MDTLQPDDWTGRTETAQDVVTLTPLRALAATLDHDAPALVAGSEIPPCWHWLYFLPLHRQSSLAADGHAKRGGFLPPVPLPRRMWAGSRLEFHAPLLAGQEITRVSRIAEVRVKEGRSGSLVFVKVSHDISAEGRLAIREEQDIVYRDAPKAGEAGAAGIEAPADAQWSREIRPDDVLLFRYSALTFNGHRIHYDRRYVTEVEGYPGLVVHGPLVATLLLDLLHRERPDARIGSFTFRAMRPLFDVAPFRLCGRLDDERTARLWAVTPDGYLAMEATATLR